MAIYEARSSRIRYPARFLPYSVNGQGEQKLRWLFPRVARAASEKFFAAPESERTTSKEPFAASEELSAHPESIKARLNRTLLRPGRTPSSTRRAFFSSREYQSAIGSHFIATGSHSELYPQSFFLIPRVSKRDWIALYCDRVAIRALPAELFSHPESIKARLDRAFLLTEPAHGGMGHRCGVRCILPLSAPSLSHVSRTSALLRGGALSEGSFPFSPRSFIHAPYRSCLFMY